MEAVNGEKKGLKQTLLGTKERVTRAEARVALLEAKVGEQDLQITKVETHSSTIEGVRRRKKEEEQRTKNNWFIMCSFLL